MLSMLTMLVSCADILGGEDTAEGTDPAQVTDPATDDNGAGENITDGNGENNVTETPDTSVKYDGEGDDIINDGF